MPYIDRVAAGVARVTSLRSSGKAATGGISFDQALSEELMDKKGSFDKAVRPLLGNNRRGTDGKDPMKYGILQSTLRDYDPRGKIAADVRDLDESGAKQVYKKIWERAGSDGLPEPLATIHFYSYVERPQAAREALEKSGLDPVAYVKARAEALSRAKGYVPGATSWDRRIESFAAENTSSSQLIRPPLEMVSFGEAVSPQSARSYNGTSKFDAAFAFVMKQEGSKLVRNDNGHGPSRFGILQTTLREYDPEGRIARNVRDLDENKAKAIYRKIWERAGCEDLSYPMSVVHFDTYVHRPRTAIESLKVSNGNVDLYLDRRRNDLRSLKSYRKFGAAWEGRMQRLLQFARNGDVNTSYLKA